MVLPSGDQVTPGTSPVSYTHLDVYKRQQQHMVHGLAARARRLNRHRQIFFDLVPVSYTHLDVYKRQRQTLRPRRELAIQILQVTVVAHINRRPRMHQIRQQKIRIELLLRDVYKRQSLDHAERATDAKGYTLTVLKARVFHIMLIYVGGGLFFNKGSIAAVTFLTFTEVRNHTGHSFLS